AESLADGSLHYACEDPDAPENFPRVVLVWRANILGSSGKGNEYFLKHLLGTDSAIRAAEAVVARLETEIADGELRAPRSGRVQYRVVQPGEVVAGGGKVVSLIDVGDVYMTFFLPEMAAGRVALGSEVRIVLDAAQAFVIPARVSYVASVAQFTPKTVETQSERQKMVFRVKARIDPELLAQYPEQVKTGLPGMAHLRLNAQREWPPELQPRLP
ncbi:MAG TPA: HlyD family efflux transporter periplasmic adaptor subunit, partial [Thauera phenylacetica]|nr:HlyD family efflux transporter periplasmic adaptor subunit [Thauera phenylacetica]